MRTDEELMAAYVAGDAGALRELLERYGPVLLGLFRRRGAPPDDAQDLVQQTFLHLHRARSDFTPGRALRPWLFTIALNCDREQGRRRQRRPETALGEHDPPAAAAPPGRALEASEDALRLRGALATLPPAQREVIELHWFQGLPFQDVARIVGASLGAVKVRAHRGYERLRALLGGSSPTGRPA